MRRFLAAILVLTLTPALASAKSPPRGKVLSVNGSLSQRHIPKTGATELWATVNVKADAVQSDVRAPLNLGLVIDRSTSMADGKLEQAKNGGVKLVEMLQSTDRIAVISYGSDVSVEHESVMATAANKELLINAIRNISLSGSTNLSGGYELAKRMVLEHSRDNTVNRVLLMSDGNANVGVTGKHALGELARQGINNGVSLTTIGVGLDYDEEVMTEMAQQGAGQYYFIDDAKKLASMFSTEFKGLSATVARKTNLVLTAAPGVEILEIKGYKSTSKGNKTTIRLAEFYSSQRKDILVRLSISPRELGKNKVLTATVGYDDVTSENKRTYSSRNFSATTTDDVALLNKKDQKVMTRVQQVRTGEAMVAAMEEQEKGNVKEAKRIIRAQRASNSAFVQKYEMEEDESFGRVDRELDSLEKSAGAPVTSKRAKRSRKASKKRAYDIGGSAESF